MIRFLANIIAFCILSAITLVTAITIKWGICHYIWIEDNYSFFERFIISIVSFILSCFVWPVAAYALLLIIYYACMAFCYCKRKFKSKQIKGEE